MRLQRSDSPLSLVLGCLCSATSLIRQRYFRVLCYMIAFHTLNTIIFFILHKLQLQFFFPFALLTADLQFPTNAQP